MATPHGTNDDDNYAKYFLLVGAFLLAVFIASSIWIIEYMQLSGIWRLVQSALINLFTAVFGFSVVFTILGRYNEHIQQVFLDVGLKKNLAPLHDRISLLEKGMRDENSRLRAVIDAASAWREKFVLLEHRTFNRTHIRRGRDSSSIPAG